MDFQVDEASRAPLYRQIADWLDGQILSGAMPAGHRLLTERELCAALQVARGTVKNAYIELEKRGKIEKIQGRGTFVVGGSMEKERDAAVAAIRRTVQNLRTHGLGAEEIDEVIRREAWLRLTEREKMRVVWVDRSPELLEPSVKQISQACNVAVTPFLAGESISGAELAAIPFDLLATSMSCYEALYTAMEGREEQIERVVLSVSSRTVSALARVRPGEQLAALYRSVSFLERLRASLHELGFGANVDFYRIGGPLGELPIRPGKYGTVIVPPGFLENGAPDASWEAARAEGRLLPFEYMLDNGSLIHLKECAQRCWERRVTGQ